MSVKFENQSYSATDKWAITVEKYGNLLKLQGMFVKELPYAVLNDLSEKMTPIWEKYKPAADRISSDVTTVKKFISDISQEKSGCRLADILKMDPADCSVIATCLLKCTNLLQEHKKLDADHAKGFIKDFDAETMKGLSELLVNSQTDWRLLADGVGFTNIECRQFTSPLKVLEAWMLRNPEATVCRLFYEANRLNMKTVCRYLNAIPLIGVSKISLTENTTNPFEAPYVTKYQLGRIYELAQKNGYTILFLASLPLLDCKIDKQNLNMSKFDILWHDLRFSLTRLFDALKEGPLLKDTCEQFIQETKTGIFEHKSPGGISHAQIMYLGKFLSQIELKPHRHPSIPENLSGLINMNMIQQVIFPKLSKGSVLSFHEFLVLYWQYPDLGANLNLDDFCTKIIDILQNTQNAFKERACTNTQVIEGFRQAYLAIKPWRSYDSLLAIANLELDAEEQAERVNNVGLKAIKEIQQEKAQRVEKAEEDTCIICMENPKNIVVFPCAHLGFCLACISSLKDCPTCRTPIKERVKIFKV